MTKCLGCGVNLQSNNPDELGYTKSMNNDLCLRCFRIKNYNDYQVVLKDNEDYLKIISNIDKTNDLVLLVVDLFDIPANLKSIREKISNDIILVITKRDILPKSVYDENIINYFKKFNLGELETIIVSSKKNFHFDELFNIINKYKKSKNVYVVGFTNAGKSTLINKLIYNYSDYDYEITVSSMPSTTIDTIEIKLNDDLNLIDTPGLLNEGSILNNVDGNTLKKIVPKCEIKPIVYQVKKTQHILIDDYLKVTLSDNDIVTYFANSLDIKRVYKEPKSNYLKEYQFEVEKDTDIVISGLGFMKFTKKGTVCIHTNLDVNIYKRDSLI